MYNFYDKIKFFYGHVMWIKHNIQMSVTADLTSTPSVQLNFSVRIRMFRIVSGLPA